MNNPLPILPDRPFVSEVFPVLQGDLLREFSSSASRMTYAPGERMYEQGFPCPFVPFIVSGGVRVFEIGESGREITLYHIPPGEPCILATNCSLLNIQFPAIAEAEAPTVAYLLAGSDFRRLVMRHPPLMDMVFSIMAKRLGDLMAVVDDVAFRPIESRLAEHLLRQSGPHSEAVLTITHAQLAIELGTSREVISRKLKDLEHCGLIRMARGRLVLVNRAGLEGLAGELKAGPVKPSAHTRPWPESRRGACLTTVHKPRPA
jgi:CRP/FNR family transcriptional regulator